VVTCIDSRIDPLAALGMHAGDVMILRNAGGRVTDDVIRTLVLATTVLDVDRILIMPHTRCRMADVDEAALHRDIRSRHGIDTRSLEFRTVPDQVAALRDDVTRVRASPFLRPEVAVAGGIYDVATGLIAPVEA
jgi:carbonic anhydrase